MSVRSAMRALSDEQLHAMHAHKQGKVQFCLLNGYPGQARGYAREVLAAQREILARARHAERLARHG